MSLSLFVVCASESQASNLWDGLFKKLSSSPSNIVLTAGRTQTPALKFSPKVISFKGILEVPSELYLTSGSGSVNAQAAELIFDNQTVCVYSPRSHGPLFNKFYSLKSCSDGSRSKDDIYVQSKIELKLNYASSANATLTAKIKVIRKDDIQYGLVFPYLNPSEGQVLMFNGEAWVASDLDLVSGTGEAGPQGPVGPAGAQGPAGEPGDKGDKGDKGDRGDQGLKGEKGDQGIAGTQGPKGDSGVAGSQGPAGSMGPQGATGPAGAPGVMGPMGPQGATGSAGTVGATGAVGAQGPKGDQGLKGDTGPTGPRGLDGSDGVAGTQGPMGPMGFAGPQGVAGVKGDQGKDGVDGLPGVKGDVGAKGDKGDKGDRGLSEIAYLRDERASGINGGTCSAGTWIQRALTTLGGDSTFTTLSGNRFTLQPGKYFVEVVAPAYGVSLHQAKLKVIETNTDVMIGTNSFSHPTSPSVTTSMISGEIIVSAASTFEIQHRCSQDRVNIGFGVASSFGTTEVYTQVKIIKKQ